MHISDDSKQPLDWFKHINENTYSSEGPWSIKCVITVTVML